MNAEKVTFKIFFGDSDIRRISLNPTNWYDFTTQLCELYPNAFHQELRLQYVDEEGDKITVSSDMEFNTMLQFHSESTSPLKLYITEGSLGQGRYFKDGPVEEVVKVYREGEEENPSKELQEACFAVPEELRSLFPNGKILPYNLPPWMSQSIQVKKVAGEVPTVDLDINIPALSTALHKESFSLIGEGTEDSLKRAIVLLKVLISLQSGDFLAFYNLACAESLLGNGEAAIEALRSSIEKGYTCVDHLKVDKDFNNIRDTAEFAECVAMLEPKDKKVPETMQEENADDQLIEMEEEPIEKLDEEPVDQPTEMEEEPVYEPVDQPTQMEEESVDESIAIKVVAKQPSKWQMQLDSLSSMGFCDTEICEKLLNRHRGDLVKVVNSLLSA